VITSDQELHITQQRIGQLQRWLVHMRESARPEEFEAMTSGYRLEIERMQAEILEYLLRPISTQRERQSA
jgi:hypothetical protein